MQVHSNHPPSGPGITTVTHISRDVYDEGALAIAVTTNGSEYSEWYTMRILITESSLRRWSTRMLSARKNTQNLPPVTAMVIESIAAWTLTTSTTNRATDRAGELHIKMLP